MYYVDSSKRTVERYDMSKFLEVKEDLHDILSSYFINEINGLVARGTYIVQGEEYRPELLSYNIYGNTQYWWILLLYNNLLSPFDLVSGMTIYYPVLDDIENLYFQLKSQSRATKS